MYSCIQEERNVFLVDPWKMFDIMKKLFSLLHSRWRKTLKILVPMKALLLQDGAASQNRPNSNTWWELIEEEDWKWRLINGKTNTSVVLFCFLLKSLILWKLSNSILIILMMMIFAFLCSFSRFDCEMVGRVDHKRVLDNKNKKKNSFSYLI